MILKVRHDELNDVSINLSKDQEDLESIIEDLLVQAESLKEVWQGKDSNEFYDNFVYYTNNMRNIATTFGNLSKFVDSANKGFQREDEEFAHDMRVEVSKYV